MRQYFSFSRHIFTIHRCGVFPYSTKVILIISKRALPTVFMNKAQNSKSKSHGLVFIITPVSKENGTYYWSKQCSYNVYYCLYFHLLMIIFLQHTIKGSVKVVNVLPCLWKEDVFTFLYSLEK